jgi:hypothetical protein
MGMAAPTWTAEQQAALVALAVAGKSGSEIAAELGVTRNAILGRAHRTGVKLPMDGRKRMIAVMASADSRRVPKAPKPQGARRYPDDHPMYKSRARGARAFTDAKIAVAIAARMAGQSLPKSARLVGASAQSLGKNWLSNPKLLALGRALYERARAEATQEAARKREIAAFEAETARLRTARINAPILAQMTPRHRLVCERRIAGETLQAIGDALGVTRERIRQIEAKWRLRGLIVPGANPLSDSTTRTYAPRLDRRRKAKPPVDFYDAAHQALGPATVKRRNNLSDAERQRRADWMREVSRRRWDARA